MSDTNRTVDEILAEQANWDTGVKKPGTTENYKQGEFRTAFERVQDPANWKNPIDAVIDAADLDITREAVIHFTGSLIETTPIKCGRDRGRLRVRAAGYYLTIGA